MTTESYRQVRFKPPAGATELILVRHGESEPAVPGQPFPTVDGHGDPALAPQGEAQAERIGVRLAEAGVDAIYVSTLRRTVQTAAPLVQRIGLQPKVEPDLREVHLGDWDGGLYRKMIAEGHPLILKMVEEERWDAIPGAEPHDVFSARVRVAIERIVANHPDNRMTVFTHGGVIGEVFRQTVQAARNFAFVSADNGSISQLVVVSGRWVLRGFNDTSHLGSGFGLDDD